MWRFIDRAIGLASVVAAAIAAMALAVTAVSIITEVIMRSVFGSPTIWGIEVSTYGVTVAAFLGSAYVLRRGRHLEIDMATGLLSPAVRNGLAILTDLAALVFCVAAAYLGAQFVHISWIIGSVSISELRVPLWFPQLAVPVGFALLALEFLARLAVRLGLVERPLRATDDFAPHAG